MRITESLPVRGSAGISRGERFRRSAVGHVVCDGHAAVARATRLRSEERSRNRSRGRRPCAGILFLRFGSIVHVGVDALGLHARDRSACSSGPIVSFNARAAG